LFKAHQGPAEICRWWLFGISAAAKIDSAENKNVNHRTRYALGLQITL